MARKGYQHRSGIDHSASKNKFTASGSVDASATDKRENLQQEDARVLSNDETEHGNFHGRSLSPLGKSLRKNGSSGNGKKNKSTRPHNASGRERSENIPPHYSKREPISSELGDTNVFPFSSDSTEGSKIPSGSGLATENLRGDIPYCSFVEHMMSGSRFAETIVGRSFGAFALHILKVANGWVERQKPQINSLTTVIHNAKDYVCIKIKLAYPIIRSWVLHFGRLMILLSVIWLDCCLRGLNSLLHLGTTSFFAVIWSSLLSVFVMIGITKMLLIMVAASLIAVFIGLAIAIFAIALIAAVILWVYGSFWTTGLVIVAGGVAFALRRERVALLLTTLYSAYCARYYVGWIGLIFGLNLSFISSDALIYILKNRLNDQRFNIHAEQDAQSENASRNFYGESMHAPQAEDGSQSAFGRVADHSSGAPSTSGAEAELTSENEVLRLLNCSDHYSALGFARFENIDASILKREYRRKAMLVHPDKNMGNEKAAEAFKKLQNAYEVLLDSLKRKTYDDDLRKEELLNYFRRFQSLSQKNGKHGGFGPGFHNLEHEDIDVYGEPRRIACKKCNDFHVWICTNRSKSRARWCQDCNDFHQAKDGDGWVEQSFQPVMFGLLQKMDPPHAYVCAESRIYNTTEWFICQGMRCPANTHKPSFHVNTSLASKCNAKGACSSNGGSGSMPMPNMDSTMTEEEFFEWLQNAMQSGTFDSNNTSSESSAKATSFSKSNGKRRRKGKKQW